MVGSPRLTTFNKALAAEHHYPVYPVRGSSEMLTRYGATNVGAGALQGFASTGS